MILESVKKWIKSCPVLKNGRINVNFLGDEPVKYCIETVPCKPIIKKYADGGSQRQYIFILASREYYNSSVLENEEVAKFYEEFANWVELQNESKKFPELDNGLNAQGIYAESGGYLFDETGTTARYQIQCRLIYYKD